MDYNKEGLCLSDRDVIHVPVTDAKSVYLAYSPLPRSGDFNRENWKMEALEKEPSGGCGEWWQIRVSDLKLPDGTYEYEFKTVPNEGNPFFAPDPYAEELTRYGYYRGVFHIRNGQRYRYAFEWEGEIPEDKRLPNNEELVIYELPMRWVDAPPEGYERQIALGTFDKAVFERLAYFCDLGINAIELLPIQDSPDTLNWGYGTRFFFAPDIDMGTPSDLKLFIKKCHQNGIRVILDVVMNHSRKCPLEALAYDMFYLKNGDEEKDSECRGRNDWGGKLFRFRDMRYSAFHARDFLLEAAEYWIKEYHIDGYRIDEFKGIDNWDFIRDFRVQCVDVQEASFPGRPFIVIAEDSWRRPEATQDIGKGKAVDAIWDFDFRDELRRLAGNRVHTTFGEASRSERVRAMVMGDRCWDDLGRKWRQRRLNTAEQVNVGFERLTQRIIYNTSHDVGTWGEQRLLPYLIGEYMASRICGWDHSQADKNLELKALRNAYDAVLVAFEQVFATFAITLTAPGIPMFLAGEEFGDLHDLDPTDWRLKMSDPIDWSRADLPGHKTMLERVKQLVRLRTHSPALLRGDVEFFGLLKGFHPTFDDNDGVRVFAYCRTGGQSLGAPGQVVVVANCGGEDFPEFNIEWPWAGMMLDEYGGTSQRLPKLVSQSEAGLALSSYQIRVFETKS